MVLTKDERTLLFADVLAFGDDELQTVNRSDLDNLVTAVENAVVAKQSDPEPIAVGNTNPELFAVGRKWIGYAHYQNDSNDIAVSVWSAIAETEMVLSARSKTEAVSDGDLVVTAPLCKKEHPHAIQRRNIIKVVRALADLCFGSRDDPRWGISWIAVVNSLTAKDGLDWSALQLESLVEEPASQPRGESPMAGVLRRLADLTKYEEAPVVAQNVGLRITQRALIDAVDKVLNLMALANTPEPLELRLRELDAARKAVGQ